MARFVRFMAGLFVLVHFALAASAAHAEKRIALVIGNAGYQAAPLNSAANDPGLIAQTLQAAGFDVVGARDLDQVRACESMNGLRAAKYLGTHRGSRRPWCSSSGHLMLLRAPHLPSRRKRCGRDRYRNSTPNRLILRHWIATRCKATSISLPPFPTTPWR